MKTLLTAGLAILLQIGAFAQPRNTSRLMTFNVRISFANDGENNWSLRKPILINSIKEYAPDILCVQESTPEVIGEISNSFPQYSNYGRGRDSVNNNNSESCHIFFNTDIFSIDSLHSGTFWFSNTPEIPGSKSWNTAFTRICTYVRLVENKTNKAIYVYNNHWDHLSEMARDSSAVLLVEKINARTNSNEPCFVTGDFNAVETDYPIQYLLSKKGALSDAFSATKKQRNDSTDKTFHGFTGVATERIDFIFFENRVPLKIENCIIGRYNENGRYPSDHFPVVADFKW